MPNERSADDEAAFLDAVGELGPALLKVLASLDALQRRLHPSEVPRLRAAVAPVRMLLEDVLGKVRAETPSPWLEDFARVLRTVDHAAAC